MSYLKTTYQDALAEIAMLKVENEELRKAVRVLVDAAEECGGYCHNEYYEEKGYPNPLKRPNLQRLVGKR